MRIIKLENIKAEFDRQTGKEKTELTTEYVCGNCRHLVQPTDKFCWRCGEPLEKSSEVEHYDTDGTQLTNTAFRKKVEGVK